VLAELSASCRESPDVIAAILVGSYARDDVDEVSDLDLILVAAQDRFESVWSSRVELSATAIWSADSDLKAGGPGAHKWLTDDLVLVELLVGESGQFRLAEPFRLLWGDTSVLEQIPRRPPIDRATEFRPDPLPVVRAYDALKEAVRRASTGGIASSAGRSGPRTR
jgi:hypothetical protein